MVQTNPAAALTGANTNGKGPGSSNKSGDDGAFSREFEQVSRGSEPHEGATETTAEQGAEAHSPNETTETNKQEQHASASASDEAEQTKVAADGKTLPPLDARTGKEKAAKSDDTLTSDAPENAQGALQAVVQQETKQVLSASTETKTPVSMPVAGSGSELKSATKGEADTDESLSFSTLRLRDMNLLNQPGVGNKDSGQAALRQGKGDAALFTLVNSSRSSETNFGEMLNTSAVSGATSTGTLQPAAPSLPAQMTLAVPMQQSGWDQAMGERVVWMARSNIQHAQIQLNPRELGPIEIKISMQNDQTHVNFVAHHATTRDAMEAALPRLREMFSEQGLNLGQADVSHHSFGDNQRQSGVADGGRNFTGSQHGGQIEEEGEVVLHSSRVTVGAVDYFA